MQLVGESAITVLLFYKCFEHLARAIQTLNSLEGNQDAQSRGGSTVLLPRWAHL